MKYRISTRTMFSTLFVLCFSVGPASAAVDIKPGSCLNPVNVKSAGVIPIAVLGGEEFPVEQNVPPAGVFFYVTVTETDGTVSGQFDWTPSCKVGYDDVTGPTVEAADCAVEQPDGVLDLLLKVRTQDLIKALSEAGITLTYGQKVTLAVTVDDAPQGEDTLTLQGMKKPKKPVKK